MPARRYCKEDEPLTTKNLWDPKDDRLMPFQLVIVKGRSEAKLHRLGPGVTVAGRQEGCQLQVKASLVSRKHCEFFEQKGHLLVKDLNSSNGTYVNGDKVDGQRVLEHGDEVSIGGVKFRVENLDESRVSKATKPADTAAVAAISPDDSDESIAIDDDATVMAVAAKEAAVEVAAEEEPVAAREPGKPELGEDAVADFLLDLDIDEDDKA